MAVLSNINKLDQTDRKTNKKKGGGLGGGYTLTNFEIIEFDSGELLYRSAYNFEYSGVQYFMVINNDSDFRTDRWFNKYDLDTNVWSTDSDNQPALDGAIDSVYLDGDYLYINGDESGNYHISINLDTLVTSDGLNWITTGDEVLNTAVEIDGKSLTSTFIYNNSIGSGAGIVPLVQVDNI